MRDGTFESIPAHNVFDGNSVGHRLLMLTNVASLRTTPPSEPTQGDRRVARMEDDRSHIDMGGVA